MEPKDNHLDLDLSLVEATKPLSIQKSLLGLNIDDNNELENEVDENFQQHKVKLQQELKTWKDLWRSEVQKLKNTKTEQPTVDISILPEDKRAFVSDAPCLQKFVRDSVQFRQSAYIFKEKDYPEVLELQENLFEACQQRLAIAKANKISENLAKFKDE